jgi:hypothetical protein
MAGIVYYLTAERPEVKLWLLDEDDALIDLASGYTFSFKIGKPSQAAIFTKTTGITGAAGTGTETSGTPNLTIAFTAGELAALEARTWTAQITATTAGLDRVWQFPIRLAPVIT